MSSCRRWRSIPPTRRQSRPTGTSCTTRSHALGGAGLVFIEMTCPSADARITPGCTGLWTDAHEAQFKRIVDFVHANSKTKMVHAARPCRPQGLDPARLGEGWTWPLEEKAKQLAAPLRLAIPYMEGVSQAPRGSTGPRWTASRRDFVQAMERAERAGFDMCRTALRPRLSAGVLPFAAHQPADRRIWRLDREPAALPAGGLPRHARGLADAQADVGARLGDGLGRGRHQRGRHLRDLQGFAEAGCDLIDVSAGQTVADQKPVYGRMFQVQFAEASATCRRWR